jgi:hypothetical protein
MDPWGEVIEQEGHPLMDGGVVDDVVVIEHKIEPIG